MPQPWREPVAIEVDSSYLPGLEDATTTSPQGLAYPVRHDCLSEGALLTEVSVIPRPADFLGTYLGTYQR